MRQTWTGTISGSFLFWAWMPLAGFHPAMVLFMQSANLIYQFWIHTEAINRMPGWFEAVFNTPSHHRVHHGSDEEYLDRNYAGTLIVWDKLFGSFHPEGRTPATASPIRWAPTTPCASPFTSGPASGTICGAREAWVRCSTSLCSLLAGAPTAAA